MKICVKKLLPIVKNLRNEYLNRFKKIIIFDIKEDDQYPFL